MTSQPLLLRVLSFLRRSVGGAPLLGLPGFGGRLTEVLEGDSYEELLGSFAPNKPLALESRVPEEDKAEQGSLVPLSLDFPVRGTSMGLQSWGRGCN